MAPAWLPGKAVMEVAAAVGLLQWGAWSGGRRGLGGFGLRGFGLRSRRPVCVWVSLGGSWAWLRHERFAKDCEFIEAFMSLKMREWVCTRALRQGDEEWFFWTSLLF